MEQREVDPELQLLYLVSERNSSLCSNTKHVALINYFKFLEMIEQSNIDISTYILVQYNVYRHS